MTYSAEPSWVRDSVQAAIARASLNGAGIWQGVVVIAILTSPITLPLPVLLAAEVALSLLILGARRQTIPGWLVVVACFAESLLVFAAAPALNSVIAFVVMWTAHMTSSMTVFVLPRRIGVIAGLVGAALYVAAIGLMHPSWGLLFLASVALTECAIVIACGGALRPLMRQAARADRQNASAENEIRRVRALRLSARETAEDRRVLHDTVINTLGFIAVGGHVLHDADLVRRRCGYDLGRLESMARDDRSVVEEPDLGIPSFAQSLGFLVHIEGMSAEERAGQFALLPLEVLRALRGATHELILNASKHSGRRESVVSVDRRGDELLIAVSDDGIGMARLAANGEGLGESVLGRARDAGLRVEVKSAPGRGLRATLTYRFDEPRVNAAVVSPVVDQATNVAALRRWLIFAASLGTVLVGVVIEPGNHRGLSLAHAMLAVVAVVSGLAWITTRRGRPLPSLVALLAAICLPLGFGLAFAAVDYGRTLVVGWQAIGIVPLLMILAEYARRFWVFLCCGLWAATVAALTVFVADRTPSLAPIVVLGAAPAVALFFGFRVALSLVESIMVSAAESARDARDADLEAEAILAAMERRRRWVDVGLDSARTLLTDIASGSRDPRDTLTQAECAREEQYLREITMMSTSAIRLSSWMTRAHLEARLRRVTLTLRIADELDARDDAEAAILGSVVLGEVTQAASGAAVNATLLSAQGVDRMLIVGASRVADPEDGVLPSDWEISQQLLGEQRLLEISWPAVR